MNGFCTSTKYMNIQDGWYFVDFAAEFEHADIGFQQGVISSEIEPPRNDNCCSTSMLDVEPCSPPLLVDAKLKVLVFWEQMIP